MPSLNFQKQFVPLIESGQKRQTIRPIRKNPIKVGDKLYLFAGLRTKKCKRIVIPGLMEMPDIYNTDSKVDKRPYAVCKSAELIRIYTNPKIIEIFGGRFITGKIMIINPVTIDKFAISDGFTDYFSFFDFFKKQYGLPFEGVLIKW